MRAIPKEKENTRQEEADNGETGEPDSNIAPAARGCRNRQDSIDWRCLIRRGFRLRYFSRRSFFCRMHLCNEAIAASRHGHDVPLTASGVAENSSERGDILSEVVFFDDAVRPYGFHD